MNSMLSHAMQAARLAGDLIRQKAGAVSELNVEQKSLHDYVSEVDRASEELIYKTIEQHYPDHEFFGEESGLQSDTPSDYRWVVDPLDGTTNFLRGIAHYAVSIALCLGDDVVLGVIYDPMKDEMFSAVKGEGAYLNGKQIKVSQTNHFAGALLATGVPFNGINLQEIDAFTNAMQDLLAQQSSGIRRLGSAALDLAYVAAGRYDGYWEARLQAWDIAAGILLVKEAGGRVCDFSGTQLTLETGNVIAANEAVHSVMQPIVSRSYARY